MRCKLSIRLLHAYLKYVNLSPDPSVLACHHVDPVVQAEGDTEAADLLAKAFAASGEGLVELRLVAQGF